MKLLSCLFLFLIVVGVFEKNYVVCGARTKRSNKRSGSVGAIRPMVKAGGAVNPNLGVLQVSLLRIEIFRQHIFARNLNVTLHIIPTSN